jgi:hypothetical protein
MMARRPFFQKSQDLQLAKLSQNFGGAKTSGQSSAWSCDASASSKHRPEHKSTSCLDM